jgi:signal transduction histidine kinase
VVVGRGEGLPNLQAAFGVWPLGSRCRDGRLLMPTLSGLVVIQPESFRGNPTPPPVVIEAVRVNGQPVAAYDVQPGEPDRAASDTANLRTLTTPLRITPGVQQMQFDFTALSFSSPENVSFRYKLEGLDSDWVDAGATRFAPYTRVPPGDYRFRVTACGHDGVWNEAGASLAFSVQPYLWELTGVRVAGAGTVVALCSGIVLLSARRRYRRKIERLEQRQALERERTRIAQDLHDDLGAGLVEINFGSELAQDPSLGMDEVREHMREIGTRAKEMVTALDEIVWAVNPKQDSVSSLATYFCQYAQHFLEPTPMRCHLDVDKNLPAAPLNAEQRHNLFLAYKEALSNAVQHSGGTDLTVHIAADQQRLTIRVSDNGSGFDPDQLSRPVGADGLGNMRRRLQQLGGDCVVNAAPGRGTAVHLVVPLAAAPKRTGHNSVEVL